MENQKIKHESNSQPFCCICANATLGFCHCHFCGWGVGSRGWLLKNKTCKCRKIGYNQVQIIFNQIVMAARNRTSLRGRVRAQVNGELPPDEPLVLNYTYTKTRPPKSLKDLPPDWAGIMLDIANQGLGVTSIMNRLNLMNDSLNSLLRDEPEFLEVYKRCLMIQKEYYENAGNRLVNGFDGNAKVWAMFMVNLNGWKSENSRQEVAGDAKNPVVVENKALKKVPTEELLKYVAEGYIGRSDNA